MLACSSGRECCHSGEYGRFPGVECVPEELQDVVNGCIELPEALVLLQAPVQHLPEPPGALDVPVNRFSIHLPQQVLRLTQFGG